MGIDKNGQNGKCQTSAAVMHMHHIDCIDRSHNEPGRHDVSRKYDGSRRHDGKDDGPMPEQRVL